ncbi:unnamed protein product [Peronospora farinosa]|uniref:BAH domain-containing protein n=1 Tax=Peronospora farinosa TaxID=134698 RepID=A0ABN8BRY1_9STRA|nr:unnamed protein product [Peronospora farinosa]
MESATIGRNKHTDSSDKSVADQQPSLADVDIKVSKTVVTTSSDEEFFEKRVTRAQYKQLAAASDSESEGPNIRGASQANPKSNSALNSSQDMKANNKATALKGKEECSGDIDSLGDYVHVQVGDCVMMDSGDPDDPYVALVSSIQTSQRHDRAVSSFMAQWYYKPYDVKEEVKALIKGGVLENEKYETKSSVDFVRKEKMYYVCRYKYYPNRSNIKKALEVVENEAIRNGLGRPKPNVGASYQANIPEFIRPAPIVSCVDATIVPWKSHEDPAVRPRHMWSPLAAKLKSQTFMQFRDLVDTLKFAVGNIVKTYRSDAKPMGHQRGIVLQYFLSDSIQICASTGQVLTILKSEVCSPLSEDLALQHLYLSRFNLSQAAYGCSKTILHAQRKERKAFRNEVELFVKAKAEVAAATRGEESSHEDSRKRKK